jgi:hypothetical protein
MKFSIRFCDCLSTNVVLLPEYAYPRAFTAIFDSLSPKKVAQSEAGADLDYQVSVQLLELYGEEILDLLTVSCSEKLTVRDLGTDERKSLVQRKRE